MVLPCLAYAGPEEARRRGLSYLLETQLPVGGWVTERYGLTSTGHKLAITAVAAHALVATSGEGEVLLAAERAVHFLRRYEGELHEPRLNDGFDYTPWAASYGLVHLRGLLDRWPGEREQPDLGDLVETFTEYAHRTQRPCGGWDYRVTGPDGVKLADGSVPFLTAVMLDGLRAWKVLPGVRRRALEDLSNLTDSAGLLGYSHDGDYAEVKEAPWWSPKEAAGRTLLVRLVQFRCGATDPASLSKALAGFLAVRAEYAAVRHEPGHVKPLEIAGYYYYHAHYYAMCALRSLLERNPDSESFVLKEAGLLAAALLSEQAADGSWQDAPAGGRAYGTALALLMLREYRDIRVRWFDDLRAGLDRAGKTGRPLLLLFTDANDASRKMVDLFYDSLLAEPLRSLVLVRLDRRSHSQLALRAKVYRGPSLLLLDPTLEKPLKSPLKKLTGGRDAKKVTAVLEKGLQAWSDRGE